MIIDYLIKRFTATLGICFSGWNILAMALPSHQILVELLHREDDRCPFFVNLRVLRFTRVERWTCECDRSFRSIWKNVRQHRS